MKYFRLPRNVKFPIDEVPEDLDEIVRNTFRDYTEGTSADYTYQDKLLFIDITVSNLHGDDDPDIAVNNLIKDRFSYELDEYGKIMDESDFLTKEFMTECYEKGKASQRLYSHEYGKDHHAYDKVMKILTRVIAVVMNWEPEEVRP